MVRCRPGTQESRAGSAGQVWIPASAFALRATADAQGRDTRGIGPFAVTEGSRLASNLFQPGTPDALAFTVAPHLQIINYRGCFSPFAGI